MTPVADMLNQAREFLQAGNLFQAETLCRQVLQADARQVDAWFLLAVIAFQVGRYDLAIEYAAQAVRLRPDFVEAHNILGVGLAFSGRLDEAVASYQQALRLRPGYSEAHSNLGLALQSQGKLDEAAACYQQALRSTPDNAEAHTNLGNVYLAQGKPAEAVACHQRALRLRPNSAEILTNLGSALLEQGRLGEAISRLQQALGLSPNISQAHNNLGTALKDQGRLDEALSSFRRAVELNPGDAQAHSNLINTLHFCPGLDAAALVEEPRRWSVQHSAPLAPLIQPHGNDRTVDRRLRIGYVSPDFRWHPVGRLLLPLLEAHDHTKYEIICYNTLNLPDEITRRCRAHADVWRDVFGSSDEVLAQTIRQDQIDILVDLTMHMAHNRLLVFARKPAPVQMTYLAYCGTTGVSTIDYRLTDPYLNPPGQDDRFYTEESIRLPQTYWCYQPLVETPPVPGLPALKAGHVTFGCLNNFCKVTAPTLAAWSRLLKQLPQARLLLHARPGGHRDRVRSVLAEQGVAADRLTFVDFAPLAEYFRIYERIDLALDTFPYAGGTTTCDAMWMGVPVVSLAGQTAVGRGGLSLLSNIGLSALVADDAEQYVRIALDLAGDLPRLDQLRATLRQRMQASPLMDARRFARDVEDAYRDMWRRWCSN